MLLRLVSHFDEFDLTFWLAERCSAAPSSTDMRLKPYSECQQYDITKDLPSKLQLIFATPDQTIQVSYLLFMKCTILQNLCTFEIIQNMHRYVLKPVQEKVKKHQDFLNQYNSSKTDQAWQGQRWFKNCFLAYDLVELRELIVDPLKLRKNQEMIKLYQNKLKSKIVSSILSPTRHNERNSG